ncbi:probable galacturonosyltransferase 7 isoform X2 [Tanacetum coccineum]
MSDNIPFDIQMEIVKKVSNVKSLIQFRLVSKSWKSFIESSDFIKDDDIETFKVQQQDFSPFVASPLLKQCRIVYVVGACHGLLCLFGYNEDKHYYILVIWNPSIGKSFGLALPEYNMPWHVEVFRLSSGVWNVIPSSNLPRQTIRLDWSTQVVIDKFIYWGARERTNTGENHMVVSFDLITQGFKVVNLPDTLTNKLSSVSVSKLRGSLVVCGGYIVAEEVGVWVMENDSSFRKLFTIRAPRLDKILGFKKTGEIIFITRNGAGVLREVLDVYDPCSQQIKNLGISGEYGSFFMGSCKESLLLLDHLDSHK